MGCAQSRSTRANAPFREQGYNISNPRPRDGEDPYPQTPMRYKGDPRLVEGLNTGRPLRQDLDQARRPRPPERDIELLQIPRKPAPVRQREGSQREREREAGRGRGRGREGEREEATQRARASTYAPMPEEDGMFTKNTMPVLVAQSQSRSPYQQSSRGKSKRKEPPPPLLVPLWQSRAENTRDRVSFYPPVPREEEEWRFTGIPFGLPQQVQKPRAIGAQPVRAQQLQQSSRMEYQWGTDIGINTNSSDGIANGKIDHQSRSKINTPAPKQGKYMIERRNTKGKVWLRDRETGERVDGSGFTMGELVGERFAGGWR